MRILVCEDRFSRCRLSWIMDVQVLRRGSIPELSTNVEIFTVLLFRLTIFKSRRPLAMNKLRALIAS